MANKRLLGTTPEADRVDRPVETTGAAFVDGSFWDVATIHEIVAKQRKRSSAPPKPHVHRWHYTMTAALHKADHDRMTLRGLPPFSWTPRMEEPVEGSSPKRTLPDPERISRQLTGGHLNDRGPVGQYGHGHTSGDEQDRNRDKVIRLSI